MGEHRKDSDAFGYARKPFRYQNEGVTVQVFAFKLVLSDLGRRKKGKTGIWWGPPQR